MTEQNVICAVRGEKKLQKALSSKSGSVFLLKADINTVQDVVERCHNAGKSVYIHLDLAEGMGKDEAGIRYIAQRIKPDGVLSTKINVVKMAKDYGLVGIYRVFMIDSQSMDTAVANINKVKPDAVEIMPGVAYDAIRYLKARVTTDVVAGGFVKTRENVANALQAGARACSTTEAELW
ncbi:MAG: glycerol-3-phosphate responsive antiterminator [Corallococcus sp.]|nr:glycerol-3-phosphate responsive antiterminator [Corallococcus sp.]